MNWDVFKDLDASGVLKNDSVVLEERQRESGRFFFFLNRGHDSIVKCESSACGIYN